MKHILLVEDNADIRKILTKRLSDKGFSVETACTGYEVLGCLRTKNLPDIVILDILLPEMSGIELLGALKSKWPETKIFVFTAYPEYREKTPIEDHIDGFFSKLEMDRLIEAIDQESSGRL